MGLLPVSADMNQVKLTSTPEVEQEGGIGRLAAWMELAFAVLQATANHAVRWKEPDYDRFRQGLAEVLEVLKGQPSPSSVLISAGALAQKIEQYYQQTQHLVDSVITELHDIVRVLVSALDEVQGHCDSSVSALRQIEERIESTRTLEELKVAKADLSRALGEMRERAREQKRTASELVASLQKRVLTLEKGAKSAAAPPDSRFDPGAPARTSEAAAMVVESPAERPPRGAGVMEPRLDPTTGLPGKSDAEEAILALPAGRPGLYLAAFYIQRMEHLNARFGDTIGNEVLLFCSQLIASRLIQPADRLFRWRGPAFVALLQREDSLLDVRQEVRRLVGSRVQFEWRNGSLLLSIALAGEAIPTAGSGGPELIAELEKLFVSPAFRGAH